MGGGVVWMFYSKGLTQSCGNIHSSSWRKRNLLPSINPRLLSTKSLTGEHCLQLKMLSIVQGLFLFQLPWPAPEMAAFAWWVH